MSRLWQEFFDQHPLEYEQMPSAEGKSVQLRYKDRRFFTSELSWMMREVGLRPEHIWGGTAGNWGKRPLDLDEIKYMPVALKEPT
jgi:hypothetical protein